ncbi:MAG: hypothetical protein A2X57_03775 [Nitrospirae bacterium GWD2_57_8]|jgi:uncharacterized RDD family membrane protein YckC|nr:MAG: hypothetical protein A2X57_03775 [Nitrospirae bacterium GWD2_57_8]
MSRLTMFLILSGVIAISVIFTGEFTGVSMQQHNGEHLMQAGSSFPAILTSAVMIPFAFLYKTKGKPKIGSRPVMLWIRSLTFFIDFVTALVIIGPILTLPALLVEWQNTESFSWSFIRNWPRESDFIVAMSGALLGMIWMLFYLSFPLAQGKQTIGQYVMGYRISDFNGQRITFKRAVLRNMLGFLVLCMWPITLLMAYYHPKKHMLHDNDDGLRPERLVYEK